MGKFWVALAWDLIWLELPVDLRESGVLVMLWRLAPRSSGEDVKVSACSPLVGKGPSAAQPAKRARDRQAKMRLAWKYGLVILWSGINLLFDDACQAISEGGGALG